MDHQLIDEYGLNPTTYRLLKLAQGGPIEWLGPGLKAITTQPAPGLRKLVERGLLSGPARTEKVNCRPFEMTEKGRDVLGRIERGLHKNSWMSAGKVKLLTLLSLAACGSGEAASTGPELRPELVEGASPPGTGGASEQAIKAAGVSMMSVLSARDAGYVVQAESGATFWYITDLGREALSEWWAENVAVEVSSGY
jgi:hypothetical protein